MLAIWSSFPLISVGAELRLRAPLFGQWSSNIMSQIDDVPGIAIAASSSIFFVAPLQFFITLIIVFATLAMWSIAKKKNFLVRIVVSVMAFFLAFMLFKTLEAALESLKWEFYVLAVGEFMRAIGLTFSLISLKEGG